MSVIPADQMQAILLNALVGKAPDVALGINPDLPVNLGVRGALANLNRFTDYPSVTPRFRPGGLVPFHYLGNDYGLPETQSFSMLFYRTDILGELGLAVPQTWDDVYAMLPELQKNGLNFYYGGVASVPGQVNPGLLPFLLQRGGSFYDEQGMSGLDQPNALAAFRQWTELYTSWKIPQQANFYAHFRTGELPIGVSDYFSYVQFHTAAPELASRWEMAPIPGIRKPDGTIDRSAGGAGRAAVLFSQSRRQAEGWQFLKWWTSTEVQVRFGEELEALLGVSARWNTANVEALQSLPWPNKDITAIMAQWEWFREQPIVLGGYFTDRHVQNAWNRVVLQGENPREALEIAVEDIDRELARKQEEFGFHPPPRREQGLSPEVEQQVLGRAR
jgi:ABC-type glycerol-3-phosphate transport system substrate-binding protein